MRVESEKYLNTKLLLLLVYLPAVAKLLNVSHLIKLFLNEKFPDFQPVVFSADEVAFRFIAHCLEETDVAKAKILP